MKQSTIPGKKKFRSKPFVINPYKDVISLNYYGPIAK